MFCVANWIVLHDAAQIADGDEFFGRAQQHAGQQIVVASQILGGRVEHKIDPRRDGVPQVVGSRQGRIDQSFDVMAAAEVDESLEIDHTQMWVRRRFADQQTRLGRNRRFHRVVITGRNLMRHHAKPGQVVSYRIRDYGDNTGVEEDHFVAWR